MTKHPTSEWEWEETAEVAFQEWFNDFYSHYTFRSEWFYGDCKVEDEKTREDIMYGWIHASFVAGWEAANYAKLEEQRQEEIKEQKRQELIARLTDEEKELLGVK